MTVFTIKRLTGDSHVRTRSVCFTGETKTDASSSSFFLFLFLFVLFCLGETKTDASFVCLFGTLDFFSERTLFSSSFFFFFCLSTEPFSLPRNFAFSRTIPSTV